MEEKANPELHLLVLPRGTPEAAAQGYGTEELRVDYPGTQVRSGEAGGDVSQPGIPTPDDVQGRHVLGDYWLGQRWHWHGQRWLTARRLICCIIWVFVCVISCRHGANFSLQYSDARLKLRQGYWDTAFQLADAGYRESSLHDTDWNWRFRVLKAEALLKLDHPQQALELLAHEPAESIPAEFKVRGRIVQARALCIINQPITAKKILAEAEPLIPKPANVLVAELAFARAACTLPTSHAEALRYYRQAAELASGSD